MVLSVYTDTLTKIHVIFIFLNRSVSDSILILISLKIDCCFNYIYKKFIKLFV